MSLILKSLFLPREKMADSDSDYASDHSDAKEWVSQFRHNFILQMTKTLTVVKL